MGMYDFFTKTVWGIIILSVIGGVVGFILCELVRLAFQAFYRKYRRDKYKKYLVKAGTVFGSGCKTQYAIAKGSFHQVLLVGEYLKDIIVIIGRILLYAIIAVGLLIAFRQYWLAFPVIISIASFFISFEYKRLSLCLNVFNEMFKYVYGEEYFKSEMVGIKQYCDSLSKKEK